MTTCLGEEGDGLFELCVARHHGEALLRGDHLAVRRELSFVGRVGQQRVRVDRLVEQQQRVVIVLARSLDRIAAAAATAARVRLEVLGQSRGERHTRACARHRRRGRRRAGAVVDDLDADRPAAPSVLGLLGAAVLGARRRADRTDERGGRRRCVAPRWRARERHLKTCRHGGSS